MLTTLYIKNKNHNHKNQHCNLKCKLGAFIEKGFIFLPPFLFSWSLDLLSVLLLLHCRPWSNLLIEQFKDQLLWFYLNQPYFCCFFFFFPAGSLTCNRLLGFCMGTIIGLGKGQKHKLTARWSSFRNRNVLVVKKQKVEEIVNSALS